MRKLTLSIALASILLASTGVASFAQGTSAPANAGMDEMANMPGMASGGAAGMSGGAMPMGDMGMMPMMMAMMMPMDGGAPAGMAGAPAKAADQAGLETKLNLLISSIETLTTRINALEAKAAN